jgi:putative tricarboxylic transport membrane protein
MMRNLVGGIAAIVIGAGYFVMTLGIRESALADAVGPAGFPKALAYSMIALGAILCAQALLASRAGRAAGPASAGAVPVPADDDLDAEARESGLGGLARVAGMLALGIVYLLIIRYLGYIPSVALLIIAVALYQGAPFSWRVIAIGVAGALVYWIIFVWLLGIPLPGGLLADYL